MLPRVTIDWAKSEASVRDLVVSIIGFAAELEAQADQIVFAYAEMLPEEVAGVLLKRLPLSSTDQVALIRASVKREGYDDFASLADDYDRVAQVRNDLAHCDVVPADSRDSDRYRLYNHRGRKLQVLPDFVTIDDLRGEIDRLMSVRQGMAGFLYRLGRLCLRSPSEDHPLGIPRTGPGASARGA